MRIAVLSVLLLFFVYSSSTADEKLSLTAKSVVLMNPWTKQLIYSKDSRKKLPPASLVKIMTALVVLKKSYFKKGVIISRFASSMEPSKINIKEGEVYLTGDLLQALLLNSANDAAVALAESVAGSEGRFVDMMNRMARAIGARDTHFENPTGLPAEGQYSTAYDISLICREAMKDKRFVDIMKTRDSEIIELSTGRRIRLKNHNRSLWKKTSYRLIGKTGYTREAGHCFAGYIEYNRWRKTIVVILGGKRLWRELDELVEMAE